MFYPLLGCERDVAEIEEVEPHLQRTQLTKPELPLCLQSASHKVNFRFSRSHLFHSGWQCSARPYFSYSLA